MLLDRLDDEQLASVVRNMKARIAGYEMGNLADLRVARDEQPSEGLDRSLQRNEDQVRGMRERLRPYLAELDRRREITASATA